MEASAMKYGAILLLLAAISGRAEAADPMGALQFFVGTWSCIEHPPNKPSLSSTFTFVMESGLLRQWIVRPKQGSMRAPYVVNSTFAYDSTHRRYVQTEMDNEAAWWVSAADSWQGDTLHWVDLSTSTTLSRWEMTRVDPATFTIRSFSRRDDPAPNYTASCKRNGQ
jgi:hypothetical protein